MNILLTGGTSGLGKNLVNLLAKESENTVLFTYCHNKQAAEELVLTYSNVRPYHVDYTDMNSVDEFTSFLISEQIDVLVNNAYTGNPQGTNFHKTPIDDFEKAYRENVIPLIKVTQACIAGMRKRKFGKIINILTSYLIDLPPAGFSVYTTTKACVRQLSKSISKEYARLNITSNCVLPEYMATGFGDVGEYQTAQMLASHPLKELLKPEDVAHIVCNIIHSSQQLNGVEIPINAAQHIM